MKWNEKETTHRSSSESPRSSASRVYEKLVQPILWMVWTVSDTLIYTTITRKLSGVHDFALYYFHPFNSIISLVDHVFFFLLLSFAFSARHFHHQFAVLLLFMNIANYVVSSFYSFVFSVFFFFEGKKLFWSTFGVFFILFWRLIKVK